MTNIRTREKKTSSLWKRALIPLSICATVILSVSTFVWWNRTVCRDCNVILISFDTLRADDLPCYGYARDTAPQLCAFGKNNSFFTHAYSHSSYTLDGHMSIFTSLYPSFHQVIRPYKDRLNPAIIPLPEILQRSGYATMYVGPKNDPSMPYENGGYGFDIINTDGFKGWKEGYRQLKENIGKGKKTFLFLHTYHVHIPYLTGNTDHHRFSDAHYPRIVLTEAEYKAFTPEILQMAMKDFTTRRETSDTPQSRERNERILWEFSRAESLDRAKSVFDQLRQDEKESYYYSRYMSTLNANDPEQVAYFQALYDERIYQLNEDLAGLFELLSDPTVRNKTIVVMTADHGEEFMEHGSLAHTQIYNKITHIPFIFSVPHVPPRTIDALAQNIDIYPTILHLLGIRPPSWIQGKDLSGLLTGKPFADTNRYLISEQMGGIIRAIQDRSWKFYHHDPAMEKKGDELYNLKTDPQEKNNVIDQYPDVVKKLADELAKTMSQKKLFSATEASQFDPWIDAEHRKKLIKEGYF